MCVIGSSDMIDASLLLLYLSIYYLVNEYIYYLSSILEEDRGKKMFKVDNSKISDKHIKNNKSPQISFKFLKHILYSFVYSFSVIE